MIVFIIIVQRIIKLEIKSISLHQYFQYFLSKNFLSFSHPLSIYKIIITSQQMKRTKQYSKPSEQDLDQSAFSIYYKYQSDPQYPLLLANVIHRTQSQLQESRAMKMLGDWVTEYQQMGEIIKYKYLPYLGKVQKILLGKFERKAAIQYCLARFFVCFFNSWREFTLTLAERLRASDPYALSFLWYTAHNLVTDMQLAKLQPFIEFITSNYEEPLRMFDPQLYNDAKKILEIVYLMNLHGCRENFADHANSWALKMRLFEDAGDQSEQIELNMWILRNHSLLMLEEKSRLYWLNKVSMFLEFLQKNLPSMKEEGLLNLEIIRLFQWLIELPQVRSLLLKWQSRYMRSLVNVIRPNPNQPKFIFNNPKYSPIINSLYQLYFKNDEVKTQNQVKDTLEKFTNHAFSILNDERTYAFLQSYSQKEIILQPALVTDILKLLNSNHIRRTLSAKVILILAKIINATINSCPFTDEMITMCLKAFSESLIQKSTDPLIPDLRAKVAQLFLHVMKLYSWEDNSKSEMVFLLCQEYEKNSKYTNPVVLQLLSILVKKFGYAIHSLHKLQPLITDLHLKIIYDQINMHEFISLLLIIYFSTRWEKATSLIELVCSKNPSPLAPFYSFQAQTLIKSNSSSSKDQMEIVASILENREKWVDTRIQVNLILLEMYFLRLSSEEATRVLCEVDKKILSLITQFYEEGNYRLLCLLAAKTLPAAGGAANLEKLESYLWIRSMSFEILARSFYKSTSIHVCYFFSNVILRADHQAITVRWLSQDQFLDYLYQGLNDFLSKEKKITLEIASTVLVFKLFKVDPSILPSDSRIPDFTTIAKNVGWWDDAGNTFTFDLLQEGDKGSSWLLPEFQRFYEEAVVEFFKEYLKNYKEKKARQILELESLSMNDDDIN